MIVTKELAEFIAEEIEKGERFAVGGEEIFTVDIRRLMCRFYTADGSYSDFEYNTYAAMERIYE